MIQGENKTYVNTFEGAFGRTKTMNYRKHRRINRTFLLKIFVTNQGCSLYARTSVHHAVNLHKLILLKELVTGLTLPFLSR